VLTIDNTKVTRGGVQKLQQALPYREPPPDWFSGGIEPH
jgi:hypothetical protein